MPFILKIPYEIFIREKITFIIWFLLILLGSLAGLIALSGNEKPFINYLLSGSFYIASISLATSFIYEISIYLLDKFRNKEEMDSSFPIQILSLIVCVILIFYATTGFKNVAYLSDCQKNAYIEENYQFITYIITLFFCIYIYSVNRLKQYPELLEFLNSTDKAKKLKQTQEGISLWNTKQ